jgi:hypothetical protein
VKDNDKESRCASLSVKAKKDDPDARQEKRVKVRKLCLFRWNAETNSYPTMSGDIIFRQKIMSFADEHGSMLRYYKTLLASPDRLAWLSEARVGEVRKYVEVLERLVAIPPFQCFWDDKYGFLVKREIRMSRIVYATTEMLAVERGVEGRVEDAKKKVVEDFVEAMEKREAHDTSFKEAVVMEAMKPERVEKIVEKHGIDGVEQTFEATAEGVGLPEEKKALVKRKLKVALPKA